jgi:hypothetical protein
MLSGVTEYRLVLPDGSDKPRADKIVHSFAVVVSQDCDLDWDFKLRHEQLLVPTGDKRKVEKETARQEAKRLPNVLLLEAREAGEIRQSGLDSAQWKFVRGNQHERYQFLDAVPPSQDACEEGLPELAIDFKRYLCIPTEQLYAQIATTAKRRTRLLQPYREHLQIRAFGYQVRVALPADHRSEPN